MTWIQPRDDDKGQELLDLLKDSFQATKYDTKSVLAGLILSLGGSFLLFAVFCVIRPRHNLIYAPRIRYSDEKSKPEPLKRNLFHWFYKVFTIPEQTLVDKLGIDAAVYIRFMTMLRNLFVVMAVIGCGVAIPVNITYNEKSGNDYVTNDLGVFGLMTPIALTGLPLACHIVLGYAFNAIVLAFLWFNFKKVIDIRRKAFMSKEYQNSLFMRTLLVTEIPRKYSSEEGLTQLMSRLKVHKPIQQINIGKNVKEISKLLERHEDSVMQLEKFLAKYLKNPDNLPAQRPQCKAAKEDRKFYPNKVDAIDYYINRVQRLEKQILTARDSIDSKDNLRYGLVSYSSPEDCHMVAKGNGLGRREKMLIQLAPRPNDIIWPNMVLSKPERKNKQWWGNVLFAAMLIAWIVPNAFIGCFLTQMSRIGQLWDPFNTFMKDYSILFSILQGFLAPMVTTLIFMILPTIMRRTSQWQGRITKTEREHDVTLKLYIFFFFNNFFVVTMLSVAWNIGSMVVSLVNHDSAVSSVSEGVHKVASQMSTAIISASSFWIMYMLRANFGAVMDLLQVVTLLWNALQRYILSPTPRQLMLATAPQPFHYAAYYNWMLFYASIALAFTSLQPLILPILAFYLCVDTVLKKYLLMYMFVTKTESDGQYWPLLNNCMLFATGFGNMVLLTVVWTQSSWKMAVAVAPLPLIVIAYKIVSARLLNEKFYYFIPTTHEREMMEMSSSAANTFEMKSSLENRYVNPAISKRLIVPLVHAKAEHKLRDVCHMDTVEGNDEFEYESNPFLPETKNIRKNNKRRSQVGDNKFDIVGEHQLDYEHYQKIAEDGSAASATAVEMSTYAPSSHYAMSRYGSKEHLTSYSPAPSQVPYPQAPYHSAYSRHPSNASDADSFHLQQLPNPYHTTPPPAAGSIYSHDNGSAYSVGYSAGVGPSSSSQDLTNTDNMYRNDDRENLLNYHEMHDPYEYPQRHW